MARSFRKSSRLNIGQAKRFTFSRKRLRVLRRPFTRRPNSRIEDWPDIGRALQPVTTPQVLAPVLPKPVEDAFVDYSRVLTPDGGILITYKDYDIRWRHTIWRVFAWSMATGFEAWFMIHFSPVPSWLYNFLSVVIVANVNLLIVIKQVELYRSIEIRPDCLIIDGTDVFWLRLIEGNWPTLQQDPEHPERYKLCGTYGTRFMEYTTIHQMDERDRAPQVLATHLADAMMKLWGGGMAGTEPDSRGGYRQLY